MSREIYNYKRMAITTAREISRIMRDARLAQEV